MRFSKLLTKTRREAPKDEVSKNAQLLIKAGFIHKEMAGIYTFLPLGFRVLKKIENIIREEMDAIGGQEMLLTTLQNPAIWQMTERWDDDKVDVWFKTTLLNETLIGLGFTHEEPLTALLLDHVHSYRDLPTYPYQIQTKFRNEVRARSGLMRGREFVMKDMYSFSRDEGEHVVFYEKAKEAYKNIFNRVELGDRTYLTFASGGSFSKYSHEFQLLSEAGEDTIYLDEDREIAVNKEVATDEVLSDLNVSRDMLKEKRSIEVGNIFNLGTRFSEALGLSFKDENGIMKPVVMGSYGLGPTRLMGALVEVSSDGKGIIWPQSVAPFQYHLIALGTEKETRAKADEVYDSLVTKGKEVLYDDREESAGIKFADADLIGIPEQIIVSDKTVEKGEDMAEVKERKTGESRMVKIEELL